MEAQDIRVLGAEFLCSTEKKNYIHLLMGAWHGTARIHLGMACFGMAWVGIML